jgi:hypothetical protein
MSTTVVKQKGKVILVREQNTEAIDAVFNLENHMIPGPVSFVSTEFKLMNEWRLCKWHLLGIAIYFHCSCFIKIIPSMSEPIDLF